MGIFRRRPSVAPEQVAAVAAEVAELRVQLAALDHRLANSTGEQVEARAVIAQMQHRVESIGAELTNQLTELSGDLDELSRRPDPTAAIAALETVRAAQVKLANEQARYQIAFREDLAAAVDRFDRRRST